MSIAGGLFNSNNKEEKAGDTKTTADGGAAPAEGPSTDLTTSIPAFESTDEGLLIETGGEFEDTDAAAAGVSNEDVESPSGAGSADDFDFDVDAPEEIRLDPES